MFIYLIIKKSFTEGFASISRREYFVFYYMKELNSIHSQILLEYANFVNKMNSEEIKKLKNNLEDEKEDKKAEEFISNLYKEIIININNKLKEFQTIIIIIIIIITEYTIPNIFSDRESHDRLHNYGKAIRSIVSDTVSYGDKKFTLKKLYSFKIKSKKIL